MNYKIRLASFLILTCAFLTACSPITRSKGTVKDSDGKPIADATVKIGGKSARGEEVKTNADGTFDFGEISIVSHQEPIEIQLTVEKTGFDKFSKQLSFDKENVDEIVLQKSNR